MRSRSDPNIVFRILETTRVGATKAEILAKLPSLTSSQLRRISAELIDKDYLRPDPNDNNQYVTTHRGHLFLNKFRELKE
jgi:predicted transcriptional regulator